MEMIPFILIIGLILGAYWLFNEGVESHGRSVHLKSVDSADHAVALRLRGLTADFWAPFDGCTRVDATARRPSDAPADWTPPLLAPTLSSGSVRTVGSAVVADWDLPTGIGTAALRANAELLADRWGVDRVDVERVAAGVARTRLAVRSPLNGVSPSPEWGA